MGHQDEQWRDGRADEERVRALGHAYADALLLGDDRGAELVVRDAIDLELTEREVAEEIVAPAMRLIGDLWERGEISIADEHLATQITLRVLALQREAFRVARARLDRRIALAAVEGEEHVVGLQMAANLLLHGGYDVSYYGPDLPLSALESIVTGRSPHVFGFTLTMAAGGGALRAAIDEVRALRPEVAVVVGGSGIPRELRPNHSLAVARSVTEVVETVDALLHRPDLN